ncbi:hypothetical protein DER46DRAFT_578860 [Fusarium sp. MPI-SDFR-AT-0072]|nr:hypothetical protein DER46DRAFT_578860 [Fusarium sp. MPI-SDFR-AT-0072]
MHLLFILLDRLWKFSSRFITKPARLDARKGNGVSLKCKFEPRHRIDWKFCVACKAFHPSLCFSAGRNVCIARTGYIRLCEHKVIRWDDVKYFVDGPASAYNKSHKINITTCENPSHYNPCSYRLGNSGSNLTPTKKVDGIRYGMDYKTETMTLPMNVTQQAIQSVREKSGKYFAPERMSGSLLELSAILLEDAPTDASSRDNQVKVIRPKPLNLSSRLHENVTNDCEESLLYQGSLPAKYTVWLAASLRETRILESAEPWLVSSNQ